MITVLVLLNYMEVLCHRSCLLSVEKPGMHEKMVLLIPSYLLLV